MKTQIKTLKIKIKSLAAEACIIRLEEQKACGRRKCQSGVHPDYKVWLYRDDELRELLHRHRVDVIRWECRHSLLAYAYLRGVPYCKVEHKPKVNGKEVPFPNQWVEPDWKKVLAMVNRFGSIPGKPNQTTLENLNGWRQGFVTA